jgi:hypothetical protein
MKSPSSQMYFAFSTIFLILPVPGCNFLSQKSPDVKPPGMGFHCGTGNFSGKMGDKLLEN